MQSTIDNAPVSNQTGCIVEHHIVQTPSVVYTLELAIRNIRNE